MKTVDGAFLVTFVAALFDVLWAQTIRVVNVGDTGSFYDPAPSLAKKGDIIRFQWTASFHSVTQSTYDNPCFPMKGGFDSGVVGNPKGQLIVPQWDLTITDDTIPIYFFCKATVPTLHCLSGMVGTINVPVTGTNNSYDNFTQNAKAIVNPSPIPSSTPVLTGVGAAASSTPTPTMNQTNVTTTSAFSSTSATSITSTTFSTAAQSSTPATVNTHSGLSSGGIGGIVGGVVGGIILIILVGLLFLSYHRARKYKREAKASQILNRPDPMSYAHTHRDRTGSDYTAPVDRLMDIHRSQHSVSVHDSLERDSTAGPSINVKELAAEIAKNMREGGGQTLYNGQVLDTVQEQQTPNSDVARTAHTDTASGGSSHHQADPSRVQASRQLPRPPPPSAMNHRKTADTKSVDTLPAYRYPQN